MNAPSQRTWLSRRFARRAAIVGWLTANAILLGITISAFFLSLNPVDWHVYTNAGDRVWTGGLYEWPAGTHLSFRYSPLAAMVFGVIAPIGYAGWSLLHLAALAFLPRVLLLPTLVAFPFWYDIYNGNTITFVYVASASALTGSRVGKLSALGLFLLMPRPFMLPVIGYLLWKDRSLWLPFVAMFAVHLVIIWRWLPDWLDVLFVLGSDGGSVVGNAGPTLLFGTAWLVVGIPLAVWLTSRRHVGWAGLALSPYYLVPYSLMLLLELLPRRDLDDASGPNVPEGIRPRAAHARD